VSAFSASYVSSYTARCVEGKKITYLTHKGTLIYIPCCSKRRAIPVRAWTYLKFNHLKPTGHVMHQQFNIQQLYALPTVYLRVLYWSENKQRLVPLTA